MKRGSALLLVLGMLSFMVISAVAFSAFMRYSRLPSSYLRRSSSSRLLVKAALAEAIDVVDAAIADNPHPGVGYKTIRYPRYMGYKPPETRETTRNHWRNHVFTGTNYLVSAADTVSTLTLEGLAYLPPALINEARYYSRHSTAAMWHSFGYDSGRFAFCAVDVSDHFNVNKVPADVGRGSSPENRFSLAYVFENQDHSSYTVNPSSWDSFMANFVSFDSAKSDLKPPAQQGSSSSSSGSGNKLPLVSVADLNLAVNDLGSQFKQYFPFVNYVTGAAEDYVTSEISLAAEMQRNMAFVTDGCFPSSGGAGADDDYDLSDDKYQPFTGDNLKEGNAKVIRSIIDKSSLGAERLRDCISRLGLVHLWDYLDEDNVPVSLAIPSVERIPMVCGIKPTMTGSSIQISPKTESPGGNALPSDDAGLKTAITQDGYDGAGGVAAAQGATRDARYVKKYVLANSFVQGIRGGSLKVVVAYPFRRGRDMKDPDSFTIDGHVEFFFSAGDMRFRTGNQNDILHIENDGAMGASEYNGNGVFHLPLRSQSVKAFNATDEDSAVDEVDLMMGPESTRILNHIEANPVLTVTYSQPEKAVPVGDPSNDKWAWDYNGAASVVDARCGIPPIGPDGAVDPDFASPAAVKAFLAGGGSKQVTLRMAVWLRVKNGDGKTVDLVPACLLDDGGFNGVNNFQSMGGGGPGNTMCGRAYPLMRFACGSDFAFGDRAFDNMQAVAADIELPNGVMCADPRWNWAPEHWFSPGAEVSKANWLQNCGKGVGDRDRDIFMATSDAGYMQSVHELAFLPRLVANDFKPENEMFGSLEGPDDDRARWATAFADARNSGLMWMTYRPFAYNDGGLWDDFESVGFVNDGGGMKVNPYGGDITTVGGIPTRVDVSPLMAAFANTPVDWWAASANTETGLSTGERTAKTFNEKYAFSAMNSKAKLDWYDLVTRRGDVQQMNDLPVVENFSLRLWEKVREQGGSWAIDDWKEVYDDLWAAGERESDRDKRLMGIRLEGTSETFYGVDRKFLYGYWRDCFAVKQQLFLIFVRAEPMMMGGGIIGQTPPQLGARAVALVWRNPYRSSRPYATTADDDSSGLPSATVPEYAPHQTRVLFYRQFD